MLEENRDLLSDITHRECSKEGAAQLPKLLFDLVLHADDRPRHNEPSITQECDKAETMPTDADGAVGGQQETAPDITSTQEIMRNLPKVWKVLTELLNHQEAKPVDLHVSDIISFSSPTHKF